MIDGLLFFALFHILYGMKLSVCMIVKNEEEVLARCLTCVKSFADQIVVVDTGSTDSTIAIAETFTDEVYHFTWVDNFSAARNYAFSLATCPYVMWLDADDVIEDEEIKKLNQLKERLKTQDTVMLKYRSGEAVYFRERILRRGKQAVWKGWVHEAIEPFGNITYEDNTILHKKEKPSSGARNLDIYRKMQQAGETFSPRDTFYFARELYYNGLYKEAIEGFDKVIASPHAWI